MQTTMAHARMDASEHTSGTLVIFTRVEGLLRRSDTARCDVTRDALDALVSARVPLVLVSDSSASEVQQLQSELEDTDAELAQAVVCDRGAALYIPSEYFSDFGEAASASWEVFSFAQADPAAAIRLLGALFVARGHDKIVSVGLGCECGDGAMLAAVDVPIVVRDHQLDQRPLLQYVPGAYLTTATGAAGWLEAVIGPALR